MAEQQRGIIREWILEPETEYRFELDPGTTLAIKLLKGTAEVFGAELALGKAYLFGSECKAAVYTWEGCTLEVLGTASTEYVSDETPMSAYANLHIALEQMRVRALRAVHGSPISDNDDYDEDGSTSQHQLPPRVLILGPEHSGKTTVTKILANYAVRAGQDWAPLVVNVDPSEGGWIVPGAVSVATVTAPLPTSSPASTLGSAATSAPTALASNALLPLVNWYGHLETRINPLLLERLIRNLGEVVQDRYDLDPEGRASGLIIDTPSSFASGPSTGTGTEHRHQLIKACVEAFRINVIIVVGHEKLNVEMQRTYGKDITVVKIPKSGGVVELDRGYLERIQQYQLHTYMYGHVFDLPAGILPNALGARGDSGLDLQLSPSSTVVGFDEIKIFRIGEKSMAPSSALPIGATRVVSEMQPLQVDPAMPGSGLLNAVLALLAQPDEDDECDAHHEGNEYILDMTVGGFLVVTALDVASRKMTILSPNPGSLAGRTAVVGSVEWVE